MFNVWYKGKAPSLLSHIHTSDKDTAAAADSSTPGTPSMERVTSHLSTTSFMSTDDAKSVKENEEGKQLKKEKEASSFIVSNPSRVIPAQIRFLSLPRGGDDDTVNAATSESQRYLPVDVTRRSCPSGIVMLIDEEPSLPEMVERIERIMIGQVEEAPMPEPFEWDPNAD